MSHSVSAKPFQISKPEKQFYHDLIQHNEQVINQSEIQHHSNKKVTTLQHDGFIYKEHSKLTQNITKSNIVSREFLCKSWESGCGAKLVFYPQFNKWIQSHEHSHAPPKYYVGDGEEVSKLCPERRREVFDWVYSNLADSWEVDQVVKQLNSKLSVLHRGKASYQVKANHVEAARNKIIQMDKLIDMEELTRAPLSHTLGEEEFLKCFELYPHFNLILSSQTQVSVLNGMADVDHLCMEVHYEDCPTGTTQLVSLLLKKPNLDAYPILFVLTREPRSEKFYEKVWDFVLKSSPYLKSFNKLNLRIGQLEEGIYHATKKSFPNPNIACNYGNWLETINRWLHDNRTPFDLIMDPDIQEKLLLDLKDLHEMANRQVFLCSCKKFEEFYSKIDREFTSYMVKTFLRCESTFPPCLWASSMHDNHFADKSLDSSLKEYQKKVNAFFKMRPSLKESVQILQQFEYLASIGKLYDPLTN